MTEKELSISLESIRGPVQKESEALEEYFRKFLRTDVPVIDRVFEHLIDGGGKRFRPLLVLLIASSGGRPDQEDIFRLAVSVEFIHTATLLHDDVVDQSDIRRGNRVAYRIWGAETSVLSGDYLYSRAFNLLAEIGSIEILDVLSSATTQMARGEVLQLLRSYSTATNREEYLEVIDGKTASLISASCAAAGHLAGFEGEDLLKLGRYGANLGFSFQIVDDVLDYASEGGVLGKAIGKDFMEGKTTLPIIVLIEKLQREGRKKIAEIFLKDKPDKEDFSQVLTLMKENEVFEETMKVAEKFSIAASAELEGLPMDTVSRSLQDLTTYVLKRKL
jgi:octaprenyl-diphosphate synthase